MEQKALIAMSGGVDSSVAAFLTVSQGFSCEGATMRLCKKDAACGGSDDVADARNVACRLNMPFHEIDAYEAFEQKVIQRFVRCYEQGLTPNPCIDCNRYMKFGLLLDYALEQHFDYVVTGHYAKVRYDQDSNRYLLCVAADKSKDQSYFLSRLDQRQLSHIRFPLGELTKAQVRQIAEEQGFINARKRDSQDICFVPDGDYVEFIKQYTGKVYDPGDFLDLNGKSVGKHSGALAYTIGQRKGLGLAMGAPVYVLGKDMVNNTVTVGPNEALMGTTVYADHWNWFPFETLTQPMEVHAKIRYRHTEQPAVVYPEKDGICKVVFRQPQRAITPGQTVALYCDDIVIGAGTIL